MKRLLPLCLAILFACVVLLPAAAQDTPPQERPAGPPQREAPAEIKPYDRVITKDAASDEGVFTVHRLKEKVYYEIPKERLGREFLWVSQIRSTTLGAGYEISKGNTLQLAITRAFSKTVTGPNALEAPGQQTITLKMDQWDVELGYSFGF